MRIFKSYQNFWRKGFNFSGVVSRKDYWGALLINIFVLFIIAFVESLSNEEVLARPMFGQLTALYALASFFPSLTITIRRLRDTGRKWGWLLLMYIPLLGQIFFLILLFQPSMPIE